MPDTDTTMLLQFSRDGKILEMADTRARAAISALEDSSDVFVGEYDVTTFAEVTAALEANKPVFIKRNGANLYVYGTLYNDYYYFYMTRNAYSAYYIRLSSDNVWKYYATTLAQQSALTALADRVTALETAIAKLGTYDAEGNFTPN